MREREGIRSGKRCCYFFAFDLTKRLNIFYKHQKNMENFWIIWHRKVTNCIIIFVSKQSWKNYHWKCIINCNFLGWKFGAWTMFVMIIWPWWNLFVEFFCFFLTNVHFVNFIKIQNVNNLAGRKFVVFVFVHKTSVQICHQTNEFTKKDALNYE